MESIALLCWCMLLVNANPINAEITSTPASPIETNTVNTIDLLQNQLNQILVQFCASEIDRNKTASAVLKFSQLSDAKVSIKNVVQFYTENYKESFDNLLLFINHISAPELQQIAYNTLLEAIDLNKISVINLLSFEHFIRTKFELTVDENLGDNNERKMYSDLLSTIGNHVKELIVSTDLSHVITFINNTPNPERIFELIPTIVRGIDLNSFSDMNRIFEFSMQLPKATQVKLISKVLSVMGEKHQYRHVFHVVRQIKLLQSSISDVKWTTSDICSLSALEKTLTPQFRQLLGNGEIWQIKSDFHSFLYFDYAEKYLKNLLFVHSNRLDIGWDFNDQNYNSVSIRGYQNDQYLSIDYCFHNESFPVTKSYDPTQSNWYFLFDDDLNHVYIKNIFTNEFLIADDISELGRNIGRQTRVALSTSCSDCDAGKWYLELEASGNNFNYNEYGFPLVIDEEEK